MDAVLWLLQHLAPVVLWLIANLPGWAWWVLLGLLALSMIRRVPMLGLASLLLGARAVGAASRGSHGNPLKGLIVVVVACAAIGHALGMGDGGPDASASPPAGERASANANGAGTVYSFDQLEKALEDRGMAAGNARIGAAVAEAESGGRSNALCDSCVPGVRELSAGAWQINLYAHPDISAACALELTCAAAAADRLSRGGMDWSPWSTFKSGAYLRHLQ